MNGIMIQIIKQKLINFANREILRIVEYSQFKENIKENIMLFAIKISLLLQYLEKLSKNFTMKKWKKLKMMNSLLFQVIL